MTGLTRKMWFSLILCSLYFCSSCGFDLRKLELLDNNNNGYERSDDSEEYDDDLNLDGNWRPRIEAIIGIAIGTVILLFVVPILLCCWGAWCCFRSRKNKSNVVQVVAAPAPMPQYVPQQDNNADVHSQIATAPTYGSTNDANQNASKDNIAFSVYPGSSNNLHATQSTNQYYNYNNGVPVPETSFTPNNQVNEDHVYEQPPPYYEVAVQSAEQYQSTSNEASKSTTKES